MIPGILAEMVSVLWVKGSYADGGLGVGNNERDQKWARPDLETGWDPATENLIFQQIDVEEGALGGKTNIRLFGVTGVHNPQFPVDDRNTC